MANIKINIGGVIVEMDKEEALKAIEAGELNANTPDDTIIYKKADFEIFKTNLANEEYKKGKVAGVEMTIKDAREKYQLEFDGKTFDNFAEALKKKTLEEAKIEPSKKIQELQADNEKLLGNYKALESDYNQFKTTIIEKENRFKKDNELSKYLPKTGLKVDSDIALLVLKTKAGVDIEYNEQGQPIPLLNGQIVKDQKTLQPVALDAFITEHVTKLGLIDSGSSGGRGGADDLGGKAGSYDAFVKEMELKGISEGSEAFGIEMNSRIKAKTLIM